jgi:acetolactate synthase-1/2/3 large subunit
MVYAGGGIIHSGAHDELRELVETDRLPGRVHADGAGRAAGLASQFRLAAGHARQLRGEHGLTECDLIIALGVRFDDRVTGRLSAFAPHAKVIHVDIDPAEIGKNRAADLPIVGDLKRVSRS